MLNLFQYAKNRFVNPSKIIDMSVYSKQGETPDENGNYPVKWRVAMTLDVKDAAKATIYSDAYNTEQEAVNFAASVPQA